MSLERKSGEVDLDALTPAARDGLITLWSTWEKLFPGRPCVITATTNGKHMKGSLHGKGRAFDIRTHSLLPAEKKLFLTKVRAALGWEWDVILEHPGKPEEHLHAEFDPS